MGYRKQFWENEQSRESEENEKLFIENARLTAALKKSIEYEQSKSLSWDETKAMSIEQIKNLCRLAIENGWYLRMRTRDGRTLGYNPRLVSLSRFQHSSEYNKNQSRFRSFKFIGFNEYLGIKTPFIT